MAVYRVAYSKEDWAQLQSRAQARAAADGVDFSRVVVQKPWGYEYLAHRTPYAHSWKLFIERDRLTSMHSHPNKKTALVLLEGEAVFSSLNTTIQLRPFDSVVIEAGAFHSTRAVSEGGVRLLEIETPPLKQDLIRLKDDYGRAGTVYEGPAQMRDGGDAYPRLPELLEPGHREVALFGRTVSVRKLRGGYGPDDREALRRAEVAVVLEGAVRSAERILYSVADVVSGTDYLERLDSHRLWDLTLLLVCSGKDSL